MKYRLAMDLHPRCGDDRIVTATDLGIAVPLEHGLQSTLLAMRLADRLKVDAETAVQTHYACQLFYIGCTANAVPAELFGADDASQRTHLRAGSDRGQK